MDPNTLRRLRGFTVLSTETKSQGGCRNSFTEHFCYEKNDDGSDKASASEEIYQGVTNGGKHGL
jgi:hypothetical protein